MSLNLNEFAKDVHANADEHGWWDEERSSGEILALIHSEWSEALEEYRDGRPMVWHECVDDSVPEIHICENCPQCLHKVGGHSVQDCMEYGKNPKASRSSCWTALSESLICLALLTRRWRTRKLSTICCPRCRKVRKKTANASSRSLLRGFTP